MADIQLDSRGLQPPEPMVRILAALGILAHDDRLVVAMDREPVLLYSELERRGFAWTFLASTGSLIVFRDNSG